MATRGLDNGARQQRLTANVGDETLPCLRKAARDNVGGVEYADCCDLIYLDEERDKIV